MKRYKIFAIIPAAIMIFSGCNDFLDEAPRGNAIAETVDDYEKMFNGSQNFNMLFFEQYYALWKSDDLIFTEGSLNTISMASSFPTSVEAAIKYEDKIYREDETTPEIEKTCNQIYLYNVIANGIMDADGDKTKKKHLLAEARVSRAYMHFLLAQWYVEPYDASTASTLEALPIITSADTQQRSFEKISVEKYYQWIVNEMEESCPDLEERTEHRMRCYKATGYALLGKVYFFMNKYDKALQNLKVAYRMLQNDPNVYLTDHNIKQAAFKYQEISMSNLLAYVPYPYRDNEVLFCKCSTSMHQYYSPYYYMEPTDYLKPEIYNLYGENDLRRNMIPTKDARGNSLKYPTATFIGAMTNIGITLPEVYLMLAECEARTGSQDSAKNILKELRSMRMRKGYEDVPASVIDQNSLIRFCVDEENREFAGTGYRFYTVRRLWNDPLFQDWKPITHTIGTKTYTMSESQLKTDLPETLLIFNESMR